MKEKRDAKADWRKKKTEEGYGCWSSMISRCTNRTDASYARYGAAGVRVHPGWIGRGGFGRMIDELGPRPSRGHSLDRFPDRRGNYVPGNVRWATAKQQAENRDVCLEKLTALGETRTVSEWARRIGCRPSTILDRVRRGWDVDDAVRTRPGHHKQNKRFIRLFVPVTLGQYLLVIEQAARRRVSRGVVVRDIILGALEKEGF